MENFYPTVTASWFVKSLVVGIALLASNSHALVADLRDFTIPDGAGPGPLISSGNILYGTSPQGNTNLSISEADGTGTIWRMNTDGTGFTNLYNFSGDYGSGVNSDGDGLWGGLVLSGSNVLYGVASGGGVDGYGTVYSINTGGTVFSNLHNFSRGDGSSPFGGLLLAGNTLYGTTSAGGSSAFGRGTIFKINVDATGFTTLHNFSDFVGDSNTNSDGARPQGSLVLCSNYLYGTAFYGGMGGGPGLGDGTIFKITTNGTGFQVLHHFSAAVASGQPFPGPYVYTNGDGANPGQNLIVSSNVIYGLTFIGGANGAGSLYRINIDGTGFTDLYDFDDSNRPIGSMILDNDTFYLAGVSGGWIFGGDFSPSVFKINKDGTGFTIVTTGFGTYSSIGGLALSNETLYGAAGLLAGTNEYGEVFLINSNQLHLKTLNSNQTNYTFQSGWTYHVTASVTLYGQTTIQSNSVIKYDAGAVIAINGTNLVCATTPAGPAIFTAKDDDSVGAIIPGSTGSPSGYYGNGLSVTAFLGENFHLSNLKFFYQNTAVNFYIGDWESFQASCLTFFNVQAQQCYLFANGGYYTDGTTFDFQNCLFANLDTVLLCGDTIATAENVTVDNCNLFGAPTDGGGSSLYVFNSIVADVNDSGPDLDYETSYTTTLSDDSGVFTTYGTDYYYLAASSPFRDSGTSSIDAGLLSELESMTTFAPPDGNYADGDPVDLGYHYPCQ